jgi:hypothetical protein
MPQTPFTDPDALAEAIIQRVGKRIVLAMPPGLETPKSLKDRL